MNEPRHKVRPVDGNVNRFAAALDAWCAPIGSRPSLPDDRTGLCPRCVERDVAERIRDILREHYVSEEHLAVENGRIEDLAAEARAAWERHGTVLDCEKHEARRDD